MDLKLLKMLCKDSKPHHVMFHELYSVSSLLCIAQNVRFEIPYKVLYFETPFLMIFRYYAWASYGADCAQNGCLATACHISTWQLTFARVCVFFLHDCPWAEGEIVRSLVDLFQVARSDFGRRARGPRAWIKMAAGSVCIVRVKEIIALYTRTHVSTLISAR